MFFLGIVIAVVGAAARNIGLEPAQIGLLVSAQNLGIRHALLRLRGDNYVTITHR